MGILRVLDEDAARLAQIEIDVNLLRAALGLPPFPGGDIISGCVQVGLNSITNGRDVVNTASFIPELSIVVCRSRTITSLSHGDRRSSQCNLGRAWRHDGAIGQPDASRGMSGHAWRNRKQGLPSFIRLRINHEFYTYTFARFLDVRVRCFTGRVRAYRRLRLRD